MQELLEEIEEERQREALSRKEQIMVERVGDNADIVLVACKDERSCLQLEDCILKGPHKVFITSFSLVDSFLFLGLLIHSRVK